MAGPRLQNINNYIISRSVTEEGREGTTENWKGKAQNWQEGKGEREMQDNEAEEYGISEENE